MDKSGSERGRGRARGGAVFPFRPPVPFNTWARSPFPKRSLYTHERDVHPDQIISSQSPRTLTEKSRLPQLLPATSVRHKPSGVGHPESNHETRKQSTPRAKLSEQTSGEPVADSQTALGEAADAPANQSPGDSNNATNGSNSPPSQSSIHATKSCTCDGPTAEWRCLRCFETFTGQLMLRCLVHRTDISACQFCKKSRHFFSQEYGLQVCYDAPDEEFPLQPSFEMAPVDPDLSDIHKTCDETSDLEKGEQMESQLSTGICEKPSGDNQVRSKEESFGSNTSVPLQPIMEWSAEESTSLSAEISVNRSRDHAVAGSPDAPEPPTDDQFRMEDREGINNEISRTSEESANATGNSSTHTQEAEASADSNGPSTPRTEMSEKSSFSHLIVEGKKTGSKQTGKKRLSLGGIGRGRGIKQQAATVAGLTNKSQQHQDSAPTPSAPGNNSRTGHADQSVSENEGGINNSNNSEPVESWNPGPQAVFMEPEGFDEPDVESEVVAPTGIPVITCTDAVVAPTEVPVVTSADAVVAPTEVPVVNCADAVVVPTDVLAVTSADADADTDKPSQETENGEVDGCVCKRPKRNWICWHCKTRFEGYIKIICPVHVDEHFLLDAVMCSKCKKKGPFESEEPRELFAMAGDGFKLL